MLRTPIGDKAAIGLDGGAGGWPRRRGFHDEGVAALRHRAGLPLAGDEGGIRSSIEMSCALRGS